MAVSDSYRSYVLDQLQVMGSVKAKKMFGGVGLYHGGVFFGLIADDTVYLKVDESNRAEFEIAGSGAFRPYGNESYSMSYYEVPADVLENPATLRVWGDKAVAVARRSATAKRKRPRSS
jgi:DNA transformation protein and related proteins